MKNENVLHRVKEERTILHKKKIRNANWIVYIFCRNCILKHIIEGKIVGRVEVTGQRGKKHRQLLDGLKEERLCCKLTVEPLDRTP